jgi:hypothetical protein
MSTCFANVYTRFEDVEKDVSEIVTFFSKAISNYSNDSDTDSEYDDYNDYEPNDIVQQRTQQLSLCNTYKIVEQLFMNIKGISIYIYQEHNNWHMCHIINAIGDKALCIEFLTIADKEYTEGILNGFPMRFHASLVSILDEITIKTKPQSHYVRIIGKSKSPITTLVDTNSETKITGFSNLNRFSLKLFNMEDTHIERFIQYVKEEFNI